MTTSSPAAEVLSELRNNLWYNKITQETLEIKMKQSLYKVGSALKTHAWVISLILSMGALAFSAYNLKLTSQNQVISQSNPGTPNSGYTLPVDEFIKELSGNQPTLGNSDAPITLIELADFQCPFCKKFYDDSFSTIKKDYIDTGKVKFVFVNLAFLGKESENAAEAAMCAKDQGKFWEYHDAIYENQGGENLGIFNDQKFLAIAKGLDMNTEDFKSCINNDSHLEAVTEERMLANKYGLSGTPTFIMGDKVLKGSYPAETFKQIFDAALEENSSQ
jgi:protein-disulfide isomerase